MIKFLDNALSFTANIMAGAGIAALALNNRDLAQTLLLIAIWGHIALLSSKNE